MMRQLTCACLLALCLVSPALAAAPNADSHRAAAEACVQALGGQELVSGVLDATMGIIMQQNPDLEPFADVMQGFFERVMPWSELGPRYVELYMNAFTEPELRDITVFLESTTGRKYIAETPALMEQAGGFANEILMAHAAELQEVIVQRAMELEAEAAAADSTGGGAAATDGE